MYDGRHIRIHPTFTVPIPQQQCLFDVANLSGFIPFSLLRFSPAHPARIDINIHQMCGHRCCVVSFERKIVGWLPDVFRPRPGQQHNEN